MMSCLLQFKDFICSAKEIREEGHSAKESTVSKLKVYDKKKCTMVFMINISSHMYGEMILGVFEIFCRGISKKFNLKVRKLQDTFLGTWTRATCVLKMSRGSP